MTCFEDLSIDLLLEIFNYLSFTDLYHAFSDLKQYFDDAIRNYPASLNLSKVFNQQDLQQSSYQCRSLIVSGLDIDIFHMKYSYFNFTSLQNITLIKMNFHTLHLLIEKLPIQQLESITIGRLTWHYYPIEYYKQVWNIIINALNSNCLRYLNVPYHIRHWNIENLSKDFIALRYATLEYISVTQMLAFLSHTPNLRRFKACLSAAHKDLFRYNIVLLKLSQLTLNLQDEWALEEIQQLFIICPYLKQLILKLEVCEETKIIFQPITWQTLIEKNLTHLIYLRLRLTCIITKTNRKNHNFQEAFNHNEYWTQRQPQFQTFVTDMMFQILLFIGLILTIDSTNSFLDKLRIELEESKTVEKDPILPFLCKMLPSKEFVENADDEDFLSSILYELGFGVLGVKPNSWAAKFRNDPHKPASCFSALYSTATAEVTKSTLASSRRIISRCCNSEKDL